MSAESRLPAQRIDSEGRSHVSIRAILILAAPLMVTNAIQAALNLTDTWFVGRLSTDSVAAMSSIYWLVMMFVLLFSGVGLAVQSFVSQAYGSRRRARAARATWSGAWASLLTAPIFIGMAFLGAPMLRPFGLDTDIETLALSYWEPRMWGAAIGTMQWALLSFFNGVGATRVTMLIALLITIANVAANQFFMFELGLGMAGAAWGTNAAQLLGLIVSFGVFLSQRYASEFRSRLMWRPNLSLMWRQWRIGAPVGVMYGADLLGVALLQLMIARIGTAPAAATQIVMMLTSIAYMPTIGVATAGTTLVGQAIGAGEREWAARLGNVVIMICVALMAGIAVILLIIGPWVLESFVSSGDAAAAATVSLGLLLLWPAAAYQAFDGLYFGSSFCMRAAGDTQVPALAALGLSWFLFVPLAHALVFEPGQGWIDFLPQYGLGAMGGWLALMGYAMILGLSMLFRWRSGRWRTLSLS